uniref:Leprecan-like alpha-helical domain-containing protein n=1 Tax=Salvator merianae TaxID=96440 RepID=A0A8D0B3I6_SALMN
RSPRSSAARGPSLPSAGRRAGPGRAPPAPPPPSARAGCPYGAGREGRGGEAGGRPWEARRPWRPRDARRDLLFAAALLRRARCLRSCRQGAQLGADSRHVVSEEVRADFQRRLPYSYLQTAYIQVRGALAPGSPLRCKATSTLHPHLLPAAHPQLTSFDIYLEIQVTECTSGRNLATSVASGYMWNLLASRGDPERPQIPSAHATAVHSIYLLKYLYLTLPLRIPGQVKTRKG